VDPPLRAISANQGDGATSPTEDAKRTIRGVVTASIRNDNGVDGYVVLALFGDGDGETSDAIYVTTDHDNTLVIWS
jgi:predicted extracellular nuclease